MTAGVSYTGTPGTNGTTVLTVSSSTPSILYFYCGNHAGMGRFTSSPDRYGTINIHDYWHLDRITKQDRQYLNRQFSQASGGYGDGVDIYIIDSVFVVQVDQLVTTQHYIQNYMIKILPLI